MEDLRNAIINAINESKLSIDCVYYILKDVYRDTLDIYNQALKANEEKEKEQPEIGDIRILTDEELENKQENN